MTLLAALDVHYHAAGATAACVLFGDWAAGEPTFEVTREIHEVAPYEPGQFYRRELPCLLAVLYALPERPAVVLIDAYVFLDERGTPGLGAHLHRALGGAVVGVAKTRYEGAPAVAVVRGESRNPLLVSALGLPLPEAAAGVAAMHGEFRIPTLLKRVDQLSRVRSRDGDHG
jgi:deoxyribonuclease V